MKKLIWYIDRDEQISDAVRTGAIQLSGEEYEILTINNPIVIDEKLKERLPDIMVIDISIASQDDGSVVRDLKARDDTKKIPIILTAMDINISEKSIALGTDDFIHKPFDMKALFEKMREVLDKKK